MGEVTDRGSKSSKSSKGSRINKKTALIGGFLFFEGEIFLSEEGNNDSDNRNNHLGWCRIYTTHFDEEF